MSESSIPTHVVLVTAIVRQRNNYLFAVRSHDDPQAPGQLALLGGKVEITEQMSGIIEATLAQELREEAGIEIQPELAYLGSQCFTRVSGHNVVNMIFLADWESGEAKPLEDQAEVRWLHIDNIDGAINDGNRTYMTYIIDQLKRKIAT